MPTDGSNRALSPAQERTIDVASESQVRLRQLQGQLHAALGAPQPARELAWARRVAAELRLLRDAITRHRSEVEAPDGLYEELRIDAPWLLPRVRQLAAQLARVHKEAEDLADQLERIEGGDLQGLPDIRHDAERMLRSLRDVLAKETDLVFERFNELPALD